MIEELFEPSKKHEQILLCNLKNNQNANPHEVNIMAILQYVQLKISKTILRLNLTLIQ